MIDEDTIMRIAIIYALIIIGVNPPKSCYACSWYNKVECPVNDGRYYYRAQRHPSCPLVELPPHGRLGDLDELKTAFPRCDNSMDIKIASVRATINHAPTIIEAEGETE